MAAPAPGCGRCPARASPSNSFPSQEATSTFQQVLTRVADPDIFGRPIVVTNVEFRFTVADQAQRAGTSADIVLEPAGRDFGPAIAVAAELAGRRDRESLMLVLAADHIVRNTEGFRRACQEALKPAMAGYLVTFGVHPNSPATSYGYIRPGAKLGGSAAHVVEAFVEKPDQATASRYMAEGFLWNSGNFMFRADRMLDELAQFEPQMLAAAKQSVDGIARDLDFLRLPEKAFLQAPKKSIDYAVMERTAHAAVLPVDFGWSDIGSWGALWKELEHDQSGNTVDGPTALIDTKDSLVFSDETILTAVVGLSDVIVVATSDAVLVVPKNQSEKVKDLVTTLKNSGRREATEHKRIHRPWGYYQGVERSALPGQAHRGEAGRSALAAKTPSPCRALGGGQGHRTSRRQRRHPHGA